MHAEQHEARASLKREGQQHFFMSLNIIMINNADELNQLQLSIIHYQSCQISIYIYCTVIYMYRIVYRIACRIVRYINQCILSN